MVRALICEQSTEDIKKDTTDTPPSSTQNDKGDNGPTTLEEHKEDDIVFNDNPKSIEEEDDIIFNENPRDIDGEDDSVFDEHFGGAEFEAEATAPIPTQTESLPFVDTSVVQTTSSIASMSIDMASVSSGHATSTQESLSIDVVSIQQIVRATAPVADEEEDDLPLSVKKVRVSFVWALD